METETKQKLSPKMLESIKNYVEENFKGRFATKEFNLSKDVALAIYPISEPATISREEIEQLKFHLSYIDWFIGYFEAPKTIALIVYYEK